MTRVLPAAPMTDESAEERRRRLARERMRRCGKRQDEDLVLVTIALPNSLLRNLIDLGEIDATTADDHVRVAAALQDFLDRFIAVESDVSLAPHVTRHATIGEILVRAFPTMDKSTMTAALENLIDTPASALDVDQTACRLVRVTTGNAIASMDERPHTASREPNRGRQIPFSATADTGRAEPARPESPAAGRPVAQPEGGTAAAREQPAGRRSDQAANRRSEPASAASDEAVGHQTSRQSSGTAVSLNRCVWCGHAFLPRRRGGKRQRFCQPAHRRAFESAARQYVGRLIAAEELPVAVLHAPPATRALLSVAVLGVPAGWDSRKDPARM